MPFGHIVVVLFFILAAIAATGAMLSLLEVPVAFLNERVGLSRTAATILTVVLLALLGSTAALSNSTLATTKIAGMTPFDLYDYITSNVLLPLGGLLLCVFVGWVWGFDEIRRALSNDGALRNQKLLRVFYGVVKVVTPILVLLVLLNGLNLL
jgi:NSS family neurotransmitter:Na+ symporter